MENLNLFIRSIFIDNMIFAYFLGMCSFIAVSKNVKTALGLGIAVTFMLVITLPVNYLLNTYVLRPGAMAWLGEGFANVNLSFLSLILFIAVIASHQVLQTLEHDTEVDGQLVRLREYPVSTVEDAIIAAVRAERDGALGVVCAPIVTPTIERIITIPVSPGMPTASISTAVERLKRDL